MEQRYIITPKASIRPNKIVFYNNFSLKNQREKFISSSPSERNSIASAGDGVASMPSSEFNKHNFEISEKASNRIKEKVSWLYELAKVKTVLPTAYNNSFTFKMNFITLTLPAKQFHQTSEITSICLHQFLNECRLKFGMVNYVWRLEFQKNGNAHYHLATDCFISFTNCKLIWNRCIQKLGYVSAYSDKFGNMTFAEYREYCSKSGNIEYKELQRRYALGCATRWDSPNTADVRAVGNAKNIAYYISKYITKKSDEILNPIVSERESSTSNLRLWFCSKSLSALKKIEVFMEEYDDLVCQILSKVSNIRTYIYDYCTVWYFNGKEQMNETKRNLWLLYRRYALSVGYIPAQ